MSTGAHVDRAAAPRLVVIAGMPGTGKTTLARGLAAAMGACYLRVDAVEAAIGRVLPEVGAAGYVVVHELAVSNLAVGNDVVADAVCAVPEARAGWVETARRGGARLHLVETYLPDADEHRRRVEARIADLPGHRVPTWDEVVGREWAPWDEARDGERTEVETTDAAAALQQVMAILAD